MNGRVLTPDEAAERPEVAEWAARVLQAALPHLALFRRGTTNLAAARRYARIVAGEHKVSAAARWYGAMLYVLDEAARLYSLLQGLLAMDDRAASKFMEAVEDAARSAETKASMLGRAVGAVVSVLLDRPRAALRPRLTDDGPWPEWRWEVVAADMHRRWAVCTPAPARGEGWTLYLTVGLLRRGAPLNIDQVTALMRALRALREDIERDPRAWLDAHLALDALAGGAD